MDKLSHDIWYYILSLKPDLQLLKNLALTSKSMNKIARKVLYNETILNWKATTPIEFVNKFAKVRIDDKRINLPPTITHLTHLETGDFYRKEIPSSFFPPSLKTLIIGSVYTHPLNLSHLTNITTLILPYTYSHQIYFPPSLTELVLGDITNHELKEGWLPPELKSLTIHNCYEFGDNLLPEGMEELKFILFNCKLTAKTIPSTVVRLVFKFNFNRELSRDVLPKGLEYLDLGMFYNKKLSGDDLPEGLKMLVVHRDYIDKIDKKLFNPKLTIKTI